MSSAQVQVTEGVGYDPRQFKYDGEFNGRTGIVEEHEKFFVYRPVYGKPFEVHRHSNDLSISHVVFSVFNPAMSRHFDTIVHWSQAFEFLRLNQSCSVTKVLWNSERGQYRNGWTFAKWWYNTQDDLFAIGVGAYGDSQMLREVNR